MALLNFEPKMEYYCVPKRVQHAYLKAKVRVTTACPTLAALFQG